MNNPIVKFTKSDLSKIKTKLQDLGYRIDISNNESCNYFCLNLKGDLGYAGNVSVLSTNAYNRKLVKSVDKFLKLAEELKPKDLIPNETNTNTNNISKNMTYGHGTIDINYKPIYKLKKSDVRFAFGLRDDDEFEIVD